jgi:hypothetical protein
MPWPAARCVARWAGLVAVVLSGPALGAVRFDTAAASAGSGGAASFDLTVGTGANRFVLVAVAMSATASSTSVLFAGQPLGPYGSVRGSTCRIEVFGRVAPPSGTARVGVSISPRNEHFVMAAAAYDGVDQILPTADTTAQNTGTAAAAVGDSNRATVESLGFATVCATGTMIAAVASPGQRSRWNQPTGNLLSAASDAPVDQLGWQLSATGAIDWAVASFPIVAAPSTPATPDAGVADAVAASPDGPAAADARPSSDASAPAPDAALAGDAAVIGPPPEPGSLDAAPLQVIELVVGTGCAAAGPFPRRSIFVPLTALVLLLGLARRRSR